MQGTIQEYTLDMADGTAQKPLIVKQGDTNSRQARFKLTAFKEPWTIPFGAQIHINVHKNDGTYANATCAQEDEHTVLAPITEQMTAVPGAQLGELFFLGADGDIRSQTFPIVVWDAVTDLDRLVSSDDYQALKDALRDVKASTETAGIATQYATEQGNAARDAAQRAEDAADSLQVAVDAAKAAKTSETNAKASETAAAQTQQEVTDYVESQKAAFVGYSKRETDSQYANAIIKTATGAGRVDVDDAWTAPVIGLDVAGRSEQVVTTGAQLFDVEAWYNFYWGCRRDIYRETVDGRKCLKWRGDSGYTGNNSYYMFPVNVKPDTQYVIEFEGKMSVEGAAEGKSCTGIGVCYQDGTKTSLMCPVSPTWKKVQLITSKDCTIESLYMPFNHALYCWFDIDSIKLYELGNAALPYEPYTGAAASPSPAYPQQIVSTGTVGTGAQLLDLPDKSGTNNGIKYTIKDGVVTASGTPSAQYTVIYFTNLTLSPGDYYISGISGNMYTQISFERDGGTRNYSDSKFTVLGTETNLRLTIQTGASTDPVSCTFKPMLNSGPLAKPWEPYTGGKPAPSAEYPQEMTVRAVGKNIANITPKNNTGITVVSENGEITINGTVAADLLAADIYIVGGYGSKIVRVTGLNTYQALGLTNDEGVYVVNESTVKAQARGETPITHNGDVTCFMVRLKPGKTYNNMVIRPMVSAGDQPLPWEPYRTAAATITLTEPLRGIGEYRDRLECRDGVWGIERYIKKFSITRDTKIHSIITKPRGHQSVTYQVESYKIGNVKTVPSLCDKMIYSQAVNTDAVPGPGYFTHISHRDWNGSRISIMVPAEIDTEDKVKAWLDSVGGLEFCYAAPTPTWTPLPDSAQQALNALTTYAGTTHLTIATGGTTPDVTLDYVQDTHKALEEHDAAIKQYTDNQLANIVAAMPVEVQAAIVDTQITTLLKEV